MRTASSRSQSIRGRSGRFKERREKSFCIVLYSLVLLLSLSIIHIHFAPFFTALCDSFSSLFYII